jgi:hypothetical protein
VSGNDYAVWHSKITNLPTKTPPSATSTTNSGTDVKTTGNAPIIVTDAIPTYTPGGADDPNKAANDHLMDSINPFNILGDILSVPHQLATSLLLTLGTGAQAVRHVIDQGPNFSWDKQNKWLGDQLGKDWSDPYASSRLFNPDHYAEQKSHTDIGTALTYGVGQTLGLATDLVLGGATNGVGISGTWDHQLKNQEAIKTFSWVSKNWGIGFSELQFDPFSAGQQATVTGAEYNQDGSLKLDASGKPLTGNGWTAGNFLTQAGNLAGDLTTDPMTYVPMGWLGKAGKVLFQGRRLLTGVGEKAVASHIATDLTELTKIAELPASGLNAGGRYADKAAAEAAAKTKLNYWQFAKFAAENDANTIGRHTVIKSINSGERENIAWLLGQANSEQDVAKVLLATEYGSQRAFTELIGKYAHMTLGLDEQVAGGYVARAALKNEVGNNVVLNAVEHPDFYNKVASAADELAKDDFSKVLSNVMVKGGPEEAGAGATALRELMPAKSNIMNALEKANAKVGSFVVHGVMHDGAQAVERRFGLGTNKWYYQVVRPFTTTAKGIIDLEDPTGSAANKFYAMLGDIDRLSRGGLQTTSVIGKVDGENVYQTYRQQLTEAWQKATTPKERANILHNAQELGLTLIGEKHGFSSETAKIVTDRLTSNKKIFLDSIDRTGAALIKDGGNEIVYHDPFMVSQTANKIMIWDWNKVANEFIKAAPYIEKTWGNITHAGYVYSKAFLMGTWNTINRLFQSIILMRGGRYFRDGFQNMISAELSGYGGEMLKAGVNPGNLMKAVENASMRNASIDERIRLLTYSKPEDIQRSIQAIDKENQAIVENEILRVQNIIKHVSSEKLDNMPYQDIPSFIKAVSELHSETHFHGTTIGDIDAIHQLDTTKPLATFENKYDAVQHASNNGIPIGTVKPEVSLTLPDTVGKRLTTRKDIETAIANGDLVHVRVAGRGRKWTLLDVKKFRAQSDSDLAKYETRVIKPKDIPGLNTKQDLLNVYDNGGVVWGKKKNGDYELLSRTQIDAMPDVTGIEGMAFPKGTFPKSVMVKSYGKTVDLGNFSNLPESFAKEIGVSSQAQLDKWIVAKGYDKLNNKHLNIATKEGIGRFTVNQDGKVVTIVNPKLADIKGSTDNPALDRMVIQTLHNAGVDWQDLTFTKVDESLIRELQDAGLMPRSTSLNLKDMIREGHLVTVDDLLRSPNLLINQSIRRLTKSAKENIRALEKTGKPINAKLSNLYGVSDSELLPQIAAAKQKLVDNAGQKDELLTALLRNQKAWDEYNVLKKDRRHFSTEGTIRVGGQDFAQSLAGVEGNIFLSKMAKDVQDVRLYDSLWKPIEGHTVTRVVKSNDPQYWEAWANVLNRNFMHDGKLDPVVRLIIEAKKKSYNPSEDELVKVVEDWLQTPVGKKYADAVGVGHKYSVVGPEADAFIRSGSGNMRFEQLNAEDFARMNIRNVEQHIGSVTPDIKQLPGWEEDINDFYGNEIAKKMLAGEEISPSDLQSYRLERNPGTYTLVNGKKVYGTASQGIAQDETNLGLRNLPDIWASVTDPADRSKVMGAARSIINNWNKAITDYPQQVFFQMPMFHVTYNMSLERQMAQKAIAKFGTADASAMEKITVGETERVQMVRKARQYALNETKKWIYSQTDGIKLRTALNSVVPFANALIFSARTLARGFVYNPGNSARLVYWANQLNNNTKWLDKNGDPVKFDEIDPQTNQRKAKYVQADLPDWFMNVVSKVPFFGGLANPEIKALQFNRQSLDPVFQGEYTNLGFLPFNVPNPFSSASMMPLPTIALSEELKAEAANPNGGLATWLTQTFPQLLPFGASTTPGSLDKLVPGNTLKQILDKSTKGANWNQAVLQAVQYVNGQYLMGAYGPNKLTDQELYDKAIAYAGPLYDLKTGSDFWLPVATTYVTPGDIARKIYHSELDKANAAYAKDPIAFKATYGTSNPQDVAINKLVQEHPEWWSASVSATQNNLGIEYTPNSLSNLKKNGKLVSDLQGMGTSSSMTNNDITRIISWVVNDGPRNPQATFDQNSYAALQSEYLDQYKGVDYVKHIDVQRGWYYYNLGYTNPLTGEVFPGMQILNNPDGSIPNDKTVISRSWTDKQGKSHIISGPYALLKKKTEDAIAADPFVGEHWLEAKNNPDPNKYNHMYDMWHRVIWGGYYNADGTVKEGGRQTSDLDLKIAKFLSIRHDYHTQLGIIGAQTGRNTLSQNPALRDRYNATIQPLFSNPQFSEWYFTFFDGDTLN